MDGAGRDHGIGGVAELPLDSVDPIEERRFRDPAVVVMELQRADPRGDVDEGVDPLRRDPLHQHMGADAERQVEDVVAELDEEVVLPLPPVDDRDRPVRAP